MRKVTDIKGEEALDVLADIIDPAVEIMVDPEIRKLSHENNKMAIIKAILKDHKKSIIEILATMEGMSVDEFMTKLNILTLPYKVLSLFNDKELISFFIYAGSMGDVLSSFESAENTEDQEE